MGEYKSSLSQLFFKRLYLKETPAQVFSCEYCEIFKNSCFYRISPLAASAYIAEKSRSGKHLFFFILFKDYFCWEVHVLKAIWKYRQQHLCVKLGIGIGIRIKKNIFTSEMFCLNKIKFMSNNVNKLSSASLSRQTNLLLLRKTMTS